jgi:TfoX/Sxy family transcriptional regulator of competence genes
MATDKEFVDFIIENIQDYGTPSSVKMFGEACVYLNGKPIFLVCNNTVYVKMRDEIAEYMTEAETAVPYPGGKPHYIFDVENRDLVEKVVPILEDITPLPKKKKKKQNPPA